MLTPTVALVFLCLASAGVGLLVGLLIGSACARREAQARAEGEAFRKLNAACADERRKALKAGVGRWNFNPQSGAVEFEYGVFRREVP
jgi:hypothetical protein